VAVLVSTAPFAVAVAGSPIASVGGFNVPGLLPPPGVEGLLGVEGFDGFDGVEGFDGVDGLLGVGTVPTPPPGVDDEGAAFSVTLTCPQPAAPSSASTATLNNFERNLTMPLAMFFPHFIPKVPALAGRGLSL
jgi:hypothetical protein